LLKINKILLKIFIHNFVMNSNSIRAKWLIELYDSINSNVLK